MMNPLYSSWNNALDYSRYPRGNTAPAVLPQMHYRYRGSTVHSVPSPQYYREILPIPTVITALTAVLPHSPLPCHSLLHTSTKLSDVTMPLPFNKPMSKLTFSRSSSTKHKLFLSKYTRPNIRDTRHGCFWSSIPSYLP